ncbi:MAG: hypothetical protein ACRD2W_25755 [Acidimicrobiales bacterium]
MKKALLIALMLVVLVAGIPLPMAMAGDCHDCASATLLLGSAGCAAILAAFAFLVVIASRRLASTPSRAVGFLHARALERPPRLA